MADSAPGELIEEFQRRRSEVWRRLRLWLLGVAPVFVVLPLVGDLQERSPLLFWAIILPAAGLAFFAAFRMVAAVKTLYRCPSCGKLATEKDGIALNPATCPHCGVHLGKRVPN